MSESFEPTIVVFVCNWYYLAKIEDGVPVPSSVMPVRVLCSGRVSPGMILRAFRLGADGVLVLGCSPVDCHYITSGTHTGAHAPLVRNLVEYVSIDPARLRLDWISLEEPAKFARVTHEFVEAVRALGPVAREGEDQG